MKIGDKAYVNAKSWAWKFGTIITCYEIQGELMYFKSRKNASFRTLLREYFDPSRTSYGKPSFAIKVCNICEKLECPLVDRDWWKHAT